MEKKTNPKIERVLALVEPGRRDALRKILGTAAYAAPVVASFSLDAEALVACQTKTFASNQTCLSANQTCAIAGPVFEGTVKCKGMSIDDSVCPPVVQPVNLKLDPVTLTFCGGSGSAALSITGGPASLAGFSTPVFYAAEVFPDDKQDTLGFAVMNCQQQGYYETGQWMRSNQKDGSVKIKGKSQVLVLASYPDLGYTLECEYDLRRPPVV